MSLRDQIRVLVVDDMSVSRGLLENALDKFGIRNVTTVDNGNAALKTIASQPMHLVISDYCMPEMDGLQLLHRLRVKPKTKEIGFILVSGYCDQHIMDRGKELRMNNFLEKPFDMACLRICLEAVVGRF